MIRHTAISIFVAVAICFSVCPLAGDNAMGSELDEIKRRMDALEKQNRALQEEVRKLKKIVEQKDLPEERSEDIEYLNEETEYMSDRLDKVERKSILDKVTVGGEIRTRLENYEYKDMDAGDGGKRDGESDEIWMNRLRLNLRSDITEDIVFHGRLSYFKFWGDTDFGEEPGDLDHTSIPDRDGDLHVERAYIDYFIPETPFSVTFGRLPVSEGPPNELRDNTTRKATWPKLMNDVESDGIIANLALEKWTGLRKSMFRFGYSKLHQNYLEYTGVEMDDARVYGTAFETEIPRVKNSLFWLGYLGVRDVGVLDEVPESAPFTLAGYPENAGKWHLYNAHLQFNDIFGIGLDWFGTFAYLEIETPDEGSLLAVQLPDGSTMIYNEVGIYGERLNGTLGKDRTGSAFYTGLRLRLPIEFLKHPRIGFEFNCGSKYWSGVTSSGGGDLVNKLDINGEAYELYYIQPIDDKHMYCRVGAVYMDHEYYNPLYLYGDQVESDMTMTNVYFLADVRF